jgi:hypothetical protein
LLRRRNSEAEDDMGGIKNGKLAIMAGLVLGCGALSCAEAAAESFGIGMVDFEAMRDAVFNGADANGDFTLSGEEQLYVISSAPRLAWATDPILFSCDDSDSDGLCSYTEFLDSGFKVFNDLDVDGDGRLSPEEVQ